jgi:predicted ATPase
MHGSNARLVVISGCSGRGKSTLLAEMSGRGYQTWPEPGRQIVKEQLAAGGDGLPWRNMQKFVELCVARATEFHDAARADQGVALFDRSIVDALAALGQHGLPTPEPLRDALARYRYARTVFMAPPWRKLFAQDEERRHGFADAVAEFDNLMRVYPANGYAVELIPKAPADFLEQRLDRLRSVV